MLPSNHELLSDVVIPDMAAQPICIPPQGRPWTGEDLLALSGEDNRYELIQGALIVMSPATPVQGRFAMSLSFALYDYVRQQQLGEVYVSEPGFELQPKPEQIIRSPDVAFVRKENIPPLDEEEGFWKIAPDLVVEIISPSETAISIQNKVTDYLTAGVRLIWIVYPKSQTVVEYKSASQIRQLNLNDSLEGSDVIPGFSYPIRDLFKRPF